MKQFLIIGLLVLNCFKLSGQGINELSFGTENTLDIMTWNIEQFPKNGGTTINYVTNIIEALDVDLIAIQEVQDINSFNLLLDNLNSYVGYLESTWFAGLAYVYKPDVIQINSIYEIYTTSQYWSYFPRSPMVIDFNYMNERIIVINNHLKCCGDGFLDINDPNDEEIRRYYANYFLKEYVDSNFSDQNVIVLGDLNDNLTDNAQNNVFQLFLDDEDNYLFADFDIANGTNLNWSFPSWPSHLDHILITNELFDEFENVSSDIQTLKIDDYLTGEWFEYDQNISDHRPVALKLSMNDNLSVSDIDKTKTSFYNYPNPFKTETIFTFKSSVSPREIEIYDVNGQKIVTLNVRVGQSSINLNLQGLSNGIYIAKLISQQNILATRKLVLMK